MTFYFLSRVGEYTLKAILKKKTMTRQVSFFVKEANCLLRLLLLDALAEELLVADGATLRISNQKNGSGGAYVNHCAIEEEKVICCVKALARRVIHIRRHLSNGRTLLNAYWDEVGCGNVTDNNIRFETKYSATVLNYPKKGIPINRIDISTNWLGGACAIKLTGYDNNVIPNMGRWAPDLLAFIEYIQQQL